MNDNDRDPILSQWLGEGPDRGSPDGLERALAATRNVRQRPTWTFMETWLPMQLAIGRMRTPRHFGLALLVALVALLVALAVAAVGTPPPLPVPIGPGSNGLISFSALFHDNGYEPNDMAIYVSQMDGSERRRVSAEIPAWSPVFSPDGKQLAFLSGDLQTPDGSKLFVVPLDGSHPPLEVGGGIPIARHYFPTISWSPDGRRIAFAGNLQIIVAASDGSGATAITDKYVKRDFPVWSPDGSQIAYRIVAYDQSRRSLAVADADGSHERILTSVTDGSVNTLSIPHWSPDGTRLSIYRTVGEDSRAILVDLDGHETSLWPTTAGAYADNGIPWSPDGRSVALMTPAGVVIVDSDGGNPRRLGDIAYCWIAWSPDGRALFGAAGDHCTGAKITFLAHLDISTRLDDGLGSWQRLEP
ncbi:MAG: hypothetical protein ABJC39_06895 [Chloroflexota bacterium]